MAVPLRRDARAAMNAHFPDFRLRTFLESLGADELEAIERGVDLAGVAARLEGSTKAVWFKELNLAGNVTGSRSRLAHAFGTTPRELLKVVLERLRAKEIGRA